MMRQLVSSVVLVRRSAVTRLFSSTVSSAPHVAIVGSGPAGFYTAQQLLKVSTIILPLSLFSVYSATKLLKFMFHQNTNFKITLREMQTLHATYAGGIRPPSLYQI